MHLAMSRPFLFSALALITTMGCDPAGAEVQCQLDRDRASAVCLANGTCAPDNGGTGGTGDQDAADESTGGTAGEA